MDPVTEIQPAAPATALSANDPGYLALRSAGAYLDLSARGKIVVTGEDRARLLHAMTTNHVQQLKPGEGCYAFFLNAQGKILGDVNIFCREEDLLLDTEPETGHSLYQHLDKFIIADDVTLADATGRMATVALEGPQALELAAGLGAPVPEKPFSFAAWDGILVARASTTGSPGLFFFVPAEEKPRFIDRLKASGIVGASPETARVVRLEHFKPRYGEDIFDTTLVQETQQMHAVHFTKGCYIGQEIVERVRSRGLVHRVLIGVESDGADVPEADPRLLQGEQNVGKITSAVFSPALGKVVGLAYARREYAAPDTELTLNGRPARVRAPYSLST